ncbi:MAG: type-F conjugative transfer system protein TraW [Pseudomonadota bacterium]
MKALLCGVLLTCLINPLFSKSFGVMGATFPIQEMSFLDFIHLRLKELEENHGLETMEREMQARAEQTANRPTPVGLPRAKVGRTFHYDPTVVLSSNILDPHQHVLFAKGTRVNGLESRPDFTPCWLFLNADDAGQLRWAKQARLQCVNPKIILTGGAIREAEEALDTVIYFDQGSALSSRFQLNAVPVIVTRDKNRLRIQEVVIKESGDAI